MAITSIVVGIDGSEESYRALAMAVGLAVREHGCVHACYVDHVPATAAIGGFFPLPPSLVDPDSYNELAQLVAKELSEAGVGGDFTHRSGDVVTELDELAGTCAADLVVVGRSTHPHLHLGGVPRQLLTREHRPVLVVP
jgi:nucleotide-binding universal stress UspA family protein